MHSFLMLAESSNSLLDTYLVWMLPVAQIVLLIMTLLLWRSTKKNIDNFTPSAFRPAYRPSKLVRTLIRCSGAHPEEMASLGAGAHLRHAVAGAMMFVPAGMAFAGVNMWVMQFSPDAPVTRMLWSLAGAVLVFLVDLGAVTALSGLKGKSVAFAIVPRVAFALTLGFFVAKPFVIIIYSDEIARMQRDKKRDEVFDVANRAHEERERFAAQNLPVLEHFKTVKADLLRRIEALTPRRAQVQSRYDEFHSKYVKEVSEGITDGPNKRPDGEGKYAKFFKGEMDKVRAELDGLNREEEALKTEQARLAQDEETAVNRAINDPKFAETNKAFDTLMNESRTSQAVSIERQLDLIREYVDAGGSSRWWGYILWHVLFILADTVPILTKLMMRKRDYQMLLELSENRIEADVTAESAHALEFAERKARARHESEMRRMELQFLMGDIDMMYQGAAHTVLRGLQVEMETRRAYGDILGRSPKTDEPAGTDWNQAMAPLRRVQERVLDTFAEIISGYGNKRKDSSGKRDDDQPGAGLN